MTGLKKRLEGIKGKWVEELPTPRRSTGKTPFSLTYGGEAVIPAKINLCNAQVLGFALTKNDELMVKQLDLLEEYRESTTIKLAKYQ